MTVGSVSVTDAGVVTKSGVAGTLFDLLKVAPTLADPAAASPVESVPKDAPALKGMAVTANTFAPVLDGGAPTGAMVMWGTASAPTGWLMCDASAVSRTTYSGLFTVIGVTFGVGDGSTTFNLPDFRGRSPMGSGTGDASDATAHSLTSKTGTETHTLTSAQMPSHTHALTDPGHFHDPQGAPDFITTGSGALDVPAGSSAEATATTDTKTTGITIANTGGGGSHPNVHPILTVNFIIKT